MILPSLYSYSIADKPGRKLWFIAGQLIQENVREEKEFWLHLKNYAALNLHEWILKEQGAVEGEFHLLNSAQYNEISAWSPWTQK